MKPQEDQVCLSVFGRHLKVKKLIHRGEFRESHIKLYLFKTIKLNIIKDYWLEDKRCGPSKIYNTN